MWQGTGSTSKWNLSCYSPRVQAVLFGFSLICSRGEGVDSGSSDTLYRCRREQEDGRWCGKVPVSALKQRRENLLLWRRLEYDFLSCLLAFAPCFLLFVFLFFLFLFFPLIPVCLSSSCPFVCAAAICYSQQVRILYCSTRSFCLCHLHRTPSRNYFVFYSFSFFFFVALISRVAFLRCALVPGTLRST